MLFIGKMADERAASSRKSSVQGFIHPGIRIVPNMKILVPPGFGVKKIPVGITKSLDGARLSTILEEVGLFKMLLM